MSAPLPPPPGGFVTAAGVRLHYVRSGEGPALVYVHGAKGSFHDFTLSVGPRLARDHTAVAIDRPGSGYSGRPSAGANSPQAQATVLRAAAAALGLERPLLVGHSMGAAVALAWALDDPAGVAAVVTLGGHVVPLDGAGPPAWAGALMRSRTVLRAFGAFARSRAGRPFVRAGLRRVFAPGPVPEEYVRLAPPLAFSEANLLHDGEDSAATDEGLHALEAKYPSLEVPLVIVAGAQDGAVPPASSERLHRLVPGSELVLVPGCGHMPQFTAPGAVVTAVERAAALAGLGAPPAGRDDRPGRPAADQA